MRSLMLISFLLLNACSSIPESQFVDDQFSTPINYQINGVKMPIQVNSCDINLNCVNK